MSGCSAIGGLPRQHVEPRGGDAPGFQGQKERVEIDDRAARGVDQDEAGLGLGEGVGADEARRLRR